MEQLMKFADALSSIGIYVIRQSDHMILYLNQRMRRIYPEAEAGGVCRACFGGKLCERCPLELAAPEEPVIAYSEAWGGYVEMTADPYEWEEGIPAYIITVSPQMEADGMQDLVAYNRMVDRAANEMCEDLGYVNLTRCRHTGYEQVEGTQLHKRKRVGLDEWIGDWEKRIHPQDRAGFMEKFGVEALMDANTRREEIYGEFRQQEPDGTYRWKSFRGLPTDNPFVEEDLYVMVCRDIHVRKQLEQMMAKQLDVAYQAIPGGVAVIRLDEGLTVLEASDSFYDALEVGEQEHLCYMDCVDERDREQMSRSIHENVRCGRALDLVYRENIHGHTRWIQARGNQLRREGNFPVYLMIRMDVSELKETQQRLEQEQQQYREYTDNVINTLSNLVEFRDTDSGEHVKRTRSLTKILLEAMARRHPEYELDRERIEKIAGAAALHDVGKIAISDVILNKPGRLTSEEFDVMKGHTVKGYEIIRALNLHQDEEQRQYCMDISRNHHERWDGNGYPDHLKGDEIPIWSQVVSVVDVYDALVSPRVYKAAFSHDTAVHMILNGECGCFNPELLECLLECKDRLRREYTE